MEITKVKQLVEILEQSSLATLELSDSTGGVKLAKTHGAQVSAAPMATPTFIAKALPEQAEVESKVTSREVVKESGSGESIHSPLVGTFYAKPSPEALNFVEVGSQVKKGQVLCIIEAMKVMNEIKSPVTGVVTEINMNNGDIVEFSTPLMTIVAD
ncbi:MAG: acetyl-CoA carboxylase biotin carboxyl carrier protein [Culicoidibacterales bacterium]